MMKSARNSIAFALSAAVLVAAPVAMAQSVHPSWYNGQSWGDPATGTGSGTTTYYGTSGSTAPATSMSGSGSSTTTHMAPPTTTGAMPATGTHHSGTMTTAPTGADPMATTGSGRQVLTTVPPPDQRRERGQRPTEQMQTMLLNNFSSAGFIAVRDFRKDGERYVAQAQDPYGNWTSVELDPATGSISRMQ